MASSSDNYLLRVIADEPDERALAEIMRIGSGGAEINRPEASSGLTPLMLACLKDKRETMKALRDSGANLEAVDHQGNTALILACREKNQRAALLLLNMFADIRHIGAMGRSPLMAAASEGLLDVVTEILLTLRQNVPPDELRAHLALPDERGETALQIAQRKLAELVARDPSSISQQKQYNAIIELLRSAMRGGRRRKQTRRHKKRSRKARRN